VPCDEEYSQLRIHDAGRKVFEIRWDKAGGFKVTHYDPGDWERTIRGVQRPVRLSSSHPGLASVLHFLTAMPLYYFKLVDSHVVADYGTHDLEDDTVAQIEAIKLARSVRDTRPDLVGRHCSISVTVEGGAGICIIPLEVP
jgi:hypothetical protein